MFAVGESPQIAAPSKAHAMKRPRKNGRDRPVQRELERLVGELPLIALREMLPDKLRAAGVEPKPALVDALAAHLINGRGGGFSWDDGEQGDALQNVKLTFTDDDVAKLDAMIERFGETFPAALEESSQESAELLLNTLQSRWPEERGLQQEEDRGFRERLEQRWGSAFEGLRMLITICRETGREANDEDLPADDRTLRGVLVRLHARGARSRAKH